MHISIDEIKTVPGKSKAVHLSEDKQYPELECELISPLEFSGIAENKGEYIELCGSVKTKAVIPCASCGKPAQLDIDAPFHEAYALNRSVIDEAGEMDIHTYSGSELVIDVEIMASIALALPMRVLCREDCKGLCALCGADLNAGECHCREQEIDPRLAVLQKFQFDISDKEV